MCEIDIPDKEFDKSNPCPEDLRRYLQASHECLKGKTLLVRNYEPLCVDFDAN